VFRPFVLGVAACAAAACVGEARPARGVTDDWGRPVGLDSAPRRIVSLSPSSTEIVFALGLGDRLVGRTTWCDYPAAARAVPDVGDGIGPNLEAVAAARPDLVLLYASEANRQALARLEAMHIGVAVLRLDHAADVRRAARTIATLAGRPAAGDSLVAAFDTALAALADLTRRTPPPPLPVYVDIEGSPPITVGSGSYLSEILAAAGARNVFADIAGPSGTVSLEAIVSREPAVVLVLSSDTTRAPDLAARPGWRAVRAVREGRVLAVDGSLYGRASPRMPLAVRDLIGRLAVLPHAAPRKASR
jgi:iron complex transport system substrate-binding protein